MYVIALVWWIHKHEGPRSMCGIRQTPIHTHLYTATHGKHHKLTKTTAKFEFPPLTLVKKPPFTSEF